MKKELFKYCIIGFTNTLIGAVIIYIMYNAVGLGYWAASATGYALSSLWSYVMNKYFTFQYKEKSIKTIFRFYIILIICYFCAYSIAKPITIKICSKLLPNLSNTFHEEIALFVGMLIYTVLNFIGQKFFCFHSTKNNNVMPSP